MPLVLQLGRARASVMDVPTVVSSFCSAVVCVLGVSGAVIQLVDPPEGVPTQTASDARARWFGEMQQRTGTGPLSEAIRTRRPTYTADLRRLGLPAIAAAAAECGLVSSLVVPIETDGDAVGVLQLVGEARQAVEPAQGDVLRRLLDVLAARLLDAKERQWAKAPYPSPITHDATARPVPDVPTQRGATAAGHPNGHRVMSHAPSAAADRVVAQASAAVGEGRAAAYSGASPVNGKAQAAPGRQPRSSRSAHAAPDSASPTEEPTRAIPAVSPQFSPTPRLRAPRSGKGRHAS